MLKYSCNEFPFMWNFKASLASLPSSFNYHHTNYSAFLIYNALVLVIVQTESIDLSDQKNRSGGSNRSFRRSADDKSAHSHIDADGLPYVGQVNHCFLSSLRTVDSFLNFSSETH